LVNRENAAIFKGVFESSIRSKSGKKFAEMRWAKNARTRVYHDRIKHFAAVGDANAFFTGALLQDAAGPPRRPRDGAERPGFSTVGIAPCAARLFVPQLEKLSRKCHSDGLSQGKPVAGH
jgi:hypothetical protein